MKEREIARAADIASWQAKMRAVVLETIDEDEVKDVLRAVLAQAKKGDLQAARLILSYAVGNPPRREPEGHGPTGARAGSNRKLDLLAYRHANGLPLHRKGDGGEEDLS